MSKNQFLQYAEDGYFFLPNLFGEAELQGLWHALPSLLVEESESRVLEQNSRATRALHGCHRTNEACDRLSRDPRILDYVKEILNSDVYVYQFKINMKAPFVGEVWPWHQDFIYWRNEDGMQTPNVINVAIFLDEVTEFNGPLYLIPKSHRGGLIEPEPVHVDMAQQGAADDWRQNVAANLKYQISSRTVSDLVADGGIVAPKGGSGSVLFFHSNLVHGSAPNISPFGRRVALITYNSVGNVPVSVKRQRPEFLVSRDITPLQSIAIPDGMSGRA